MKKLTPVILITSLLFTSCGIKPINDNDLTLIKQEIPLNNHTKEYNLVNESITSYFYEEGNVPYIDLATFVQGLDGFYELEGFNFDINPNINEATYKWNANNNPYDLTVNWAKETLKVNSMDYFNHLKAIEVTDYGAHSEWAGVEATKEDAVTFKLQPYNFDILYYNDLVLVPFPILNTLFCATNQTNIIYNGHAYEFFFQEFSEEEMEDLRKSEFNAKLAPLDVREASKNGLLFTLDYFYGLKDYKGIDRGFANYISDADLEKLDSQIPGTFSEAYYNILFKQLDELHTGVNSLSIYNRLNADPIMDIQNVGNTLISHSRTYWDLFDSYNATFGEYRPVQFEGNTAFIKFDGFSIAPVADLYDENGNLKPDAWEIDTYSLMLKAMEEIKTRPYIENIVVDLSTNGGGTIGALLTSLGFLTNEDIEFTTFDTLSNYGRIDYYKIDSDNDGDYEDDDGYPEYNWHILSSRASFSAANAFIAIASNMGIATIIGQTSGGGMAGVMPGALMDGTTFRISSNFTIRVPERLGRNKINFKEIESGITPDYEIPYAYFYDLAYINDFINNGYEG